jgi:DNA-directed RNA polymerase subunit RPC12/RpoP
VSRDIRRRLDRLEEHREPEPCPECGGKILLQERHPDGTVTYPFEELCSACENVPTQPSAVSFIEFVMGEGGGGGR